MREKYKVCQNVLTFILILTQKNRLHYFAQHSTYDLIYVTDKIHTKVTTKFLTIFGRKIDNTFAEEAE